MNRKIVIFILFFAVVFLVVGCGNDETEKMQGTYEIMIDNTVEIVYGKENRIIPYLVDSSGTIVESRFDYIVSSDKVQVDMNGNVTWTEFPKEDITLTVSERNIGTKKTITLTFVIEELTTVTTITSSDGKSVSEIKQISFGQDVTLNVISNLGPLAEIDKYCSITATDKDGNCKNIFKSTFSGNQIVLKTVGVGTGELSIEIKDSNGKKLFGFSVPYAIDARDSGLIGKALKSNNTSALGYDELQKIDVIEIDDTIKDVSELTLFENLKTIVLNTSEPISCKEFNSSYFYRVPAEKYKTYYELSEWSNLKDKIIPFNKSIDEKYVIYHSDRADVLSYDLIDNDFSLKMLTFQGYTNIGWKDKSNISVYNHSIKDFSESCIHLYAVWTPNGNKIVFDGNGATDGNMEEQIIETDSSAKLIQNTYTRLGYDFLGWSTTPDGEVEYGDEVSFLMGYEGVNVLYAVWKESTEGFEFELNENETYTVVGYSGNKAEIRIPSHYEGILVTQIGANAFSNNDALTRVVITNNVTGIGESAFEQCINLMSLTIGDSVTSIGNKAFYDCKNLISLIMRNNVESIGWYAFCNCTNLTSITIPNSVNSIGDYAFENCVKLVEVINKSSLNIVKGASSYGGVAYYAFDVHDGDSNVVNKKGYLFYTCKDVNYLVNYIDKDKNLILPTNYNGENYVINNYAFAYCDNLTSIMISDNVISIGKNAFCYCGILEIVTIGNDVTRIGENAFYYCSSLESVTIGNGVTSIGENAFFNCSSLMSIIVDEDNAFYKSVDGNLYTKDEKTLIRYAIGKNDTNFVIPDSVKNIGDYAFINCTNLISVTVGNNVIVIGENAFRVCTNLTSVTIGDGVTCIGSHAFAYCKNLTSAIIGNSVVSIDLGAFEGCDSLISIIIPNSVTNIGDYAFYSCDYLSSAMIGNHVASIGDYAFSLSNITGVTIPDSVVSIGDYAFYSCDWLSSVRLGNNVTSIGSHAFDYCYRLESIIIPNSVPIIEDYVFYHCTRLTSVTIGNGVTSIGSHAFDYCYRIENITIPDNVTSIGDYAFYSCTGLTSVMMGNGVTSIGTKAFYDCESLLAVSIGNSVTSIGDYAFYFCESLTDLTIGNNVKSIGNYAFFGCVKLASVNIPNSVTNIGANAFRSCHRLSNVIIGNGVKTIGSYAFNDCKSLTSITIPDSVTRIGSNAFNNCNSLTSVIFKNTNGWKAGTNHISATELANASTAAIYLTSTYVSSLWTRE